MKNWTVATPLVLALARSSVAHDSSFSGSTIVFTVLVNDPGQCVLVDNARLFLRK